MEEMAEARSRRGKSMSAKTSADVLIGGKIYTLSGYESEDYLQRVANYINGKINEFDEMEQFRRFPGEMKATLVELNIADDYFKAREQAEKLDQDVKEKDREIYELKHELISLRIKAESSDKTASDLEKENRQLLLYKAKLENALEDALLGKVKGQAVEERKGSGNQKAGPNKNTGSQPEGQNKSDGGQPEDQKKSDGGQLTGQKKEDGGYPKQKKENSQPNGTKHDRENPKAGYQNVSFANQPSQENRQAAPVSQENGQEPSVGQENGKILPESKENGQAQSAAQGNGQMPSLGQEAEEGQKDSRRAQGPSAGRGWDFGNRPDSGQTHPTYQDSDTRKQNQRTEEHG